MSYLREEWLCARDTDPAPVHHADCLCGCRYDPKSSAGAVTSEVGPAPAEQP